MLYGVGDPATRVFATSDSDAASITRDEVVGFYHDHVGPGTTTLVIVGDIADRDAVAEAGRVFGGWPRGASGEPAESTPPSAAAIPAPRPTAIYLHDAPGTQAFVYIGAAGPVRGGARRPRRPPRPRSSPSATQEPPWGRFSADLLGTTAQLRSDLGVVGP